MWSRISAMRLLILLICTIIFPSPVLAQGNQTYLPPGTNYSSQSSEGGQTFLPPGTNYSNDAALIDRINRKSTNIKDPDIQKVTEVLLEFVREDYMEDKQFGIRMKIPENMTGCFEFSPLEYEASFIESTYMDIKVKNFRRKPIDTKNASYDCDKRNKAVSTMVITSADELERRRIQKIRFSNGQKTDYYQVRLYDDYIQLIPESMVIFKFPNISKGAEPKVTHHFRGEDVIIALHVPMAKENDNISDAVRQMAYKQALIPVSSVDGIRISSPNVFLFKDSNGSFLDGLNKDGYKEVGTIQVMRPYLSDRGLARTPVDLKVFATKPTTRL